MAASVHFRRSKLAAMAASVWIQCTSGASYSFGVYSPLLKSSQAYDQSTLDSVAFFKDAGANIGVLSGLLYSSFSGGEGSWIVLAAGAVQCFAGYFLMWLSVTGALPRPPSALMCFYMFLAAHSQTFFNTADVVTAVENFPSSRGTVVGIMKGFLGLSGAILIQIYRTFFNGNPSSFLLMLALLPTLLPLLLMYFVQVHHTKGGDEQRYLNAFSLVSMAVASYLMTVIIGEEFITFQVSVRIITFTLLLLLLLSPLTIVLKAQSKESRSRPESSHHEKIRLIEDLNRPENKEQKSSRDQTLLTRGENLNLFQAMWTWEFWLLSIVMACAMGSGLATVNNISQIGNSLGYTSMETSTLVSLWSIWNFLGRFGIGYISDYFLHKNGCPRPFFIALTLALMSFGHAIISTGLPGSLHVGSVLVGVCYGSQWSLMPTITSEFFGIRHFGTIFNTVAIASPIGSYILSVRVVGYIYDIETSSGMEACKGRLFLRGLCRDVKKHLHCPGSLSIEVLASGIFEERRKGAPAILKAPLAFCSYEGSSCCNATDDTALQKQFNSMNISDSTCGSLVKSILCTKCDSYSADLFSIEPNIRMVPFLCNSTTSVSSSQSSKDAAGDFCTQVWDSCKEVPIRNSPFATSLQGSAGVPVSSSKLTDLWQSKTDFCKAFGRSAGSESICFNGKSVSFNSTVDSTPPKGICLEKLGNGSYLSMVPHPDGSNRVFLSNQAGKIWLATVPAQGSGGTLDFDDSNPFLDITDMVHSDTAFGVMGLAFHPNYTNNGRFFVSFNCDKTQTASCSGRCSCNSDVDCDPSKLGLDNGAQPCRYQSVISEFTVNAPSTKPSEAASAAPSEVRRIFTMGLPFTGHHGGQILFGPEDGYLYFMMGDGGNEGDPLNFAQNKKSLLGKIMRLDVNKIPSSSEGLWGNYSIPEDNPSADDTQLQAEIWALGLRNPWRCSFDSKKPSYFFCADVGEETYEEVDLISKGGNYGWRVFEGPEVFHPKSSPGGNTSLSSINPIFPILGYTHSSVSSNVRSASITGGYVYRANSDPCLYGRYLYADLYGSALWAGIENPEDSGNFSSTKLPFGCAKSTPIDCDSVEGSPLPSVGIIYSFAEDNNKDVYLLASKGVYRVVPPSHCSYTCPKESLVDNASPPPAGTSPSTGHFEKLQLKLVLFLISFIILLGSL